jgi:hypothetical protein
LELFHRFAIVVVIGEQMAIAIERHGDAGVPHDDLKPLWRPTQVGNKQARSGVAKGVERIFCSAAVADAGGQLQRYPAAAPDRLGIEDAAAEFSS